MSKYSIITLIIIVIIELGFIVAFKVKNDNLTAEMIKVETMRAIEKATFEDIARKQKASENKLTEKQELVVIKYIPTQTNLDSCERKLKAIEDIVMVFYER